MTVREIEWGTFRPLPRVGSVIKWDGDRWKIWGRHRRTLFVEKED